MLAAVPLAWRAEFLADFHIWLKEESHTDVFAAYMEVLTLQLQWQLGVSDS